MKHLALSALVALSTLFASCGGGGGGSSGSGSVSLVLTDNASEELTQFEVDVSNVVFTKASGATVSVMPRSQRIDFLQLDSISELIAAFSLEAGFYERITMTLDFAEARVLIVDQVTAATILDQNGNAITGEFQVEVDLKNGSRPFVRANRGMLLVLDLDLEQSVSVDNGSNSVTFAPVWSVEADPTSPEPAITSGTLQRIDTTARTFYVERRAIDNTVVDVFPVVTSATTIFQMGGVAFVGDVGLGSLVNHLGERIYVQGLVDTASVGGTIRAVAVETGAGVVGNGQDWVYGHVVARNGAAGSDATLTVLGRSRDVSTGTRAYNTLHTVDVSVLNTKVLRRGFGASYGTDAINVGQRVWVFGSLSGTSLDATAIDGVARMLKTSIYGIADSAVSNDTLTVDVQRFGRRNISRFDFDVSGQVQADPNAFTIDVTGLSTTGIQNNSRTRVFGWIRPVDAAGTDAEALSLVDRSAGPKLLLCAWAPARSNVLDASGSVPRIEIDVSQALIRAIADGFAPTVLTETPAPTVRPLLNRGFYRIVENGGVVVYVSFDEFQQAVAERTATSPVARISAFGTYDGAQQLLSALSATVVLR
tara:strand:+ start:38982 stop:40760 length:1779 start_codon:yes stop_codon:yes gene_type:complete